MGQLDLGIGEFSRSVRRVTFSGDLKRLIISVGWLGYPTGFESSSVGNMRHIDRARSGWKAKLLWKIVPLCLTIAFCIGLQALKSETASAQQRPRHVASLNLCTDQLLLALGDREQIASLSRLVTDPTISFMAQEAKGLPLNDGTAEAILFARPDLVLTGTYGRQSQALLLKVQGLNVLAFAPWSSLAQGREQILAASLALGHPERGETLVARIDDALRRANDIVHGDRSILIYDRGGWVSGSSSPISEILIHMGFKPHQQVLGLAQGGIARLESIVAAPPDFLVLNESTDQAVDNGTAFFAHPALMRVVPPERRLVMPSRLTLCGGPSIPAAIDALAAEVRAKIR